VHARFGSFLGGPEARRRQRVTLPHKNWTIVPISKYTILRQRISIGLNLHPRFHPPVRRAKACLVPQRVRGKSYTSRSIAYMAPGRNLPPRRPARRENVNESIRAREVRAVFPDGTAEIMPTAAALRRAQELGLDLVIVSPTAVPPVAKAVDYGHYQYEQKKKQHEAKK